ncbi:MAG: ankyrin repeat domain-containing protein, partial [bacterium]|nr:ankyrin repeat domain-containing protein [bacterium]
MQLVAFGVMTPAALCAADSPSGGATGERNLIMGTGEARQPQPFTREQRLLDAVRRGDRATVEVALELGVAVDTADDLQRSALLLAARDAGDTDLVRFLHERGGAIDRADASGRTPLSYAASTGRLELV